MDFRLLIARRYLISPKRLSLISVITGITVGGIALGTAALIVVLSVMNGFFDVVRDLLVSFDPHVRIVAADARGLERPDSLMAVALENDDVHFATAYVEGKALISHTGPTDVNKVVIVRGVDEETLGGVSEVADRIVFGSFNLERRAGRPGIVIGSSLGARLALFPGGGTREASELALLSAAGIERALTQAVGMPAFTVFDVRGLYELEAIYDESHVFVSLPEAQRLFRMGNRVSGVELRLNDIDNAWRVQRDLQRRLDPERFSVLTWYDLQRSLYDVMRLEKMVATLVLALIILIAAFNLVGSLTMVVIEKRRDISILRAMGTSRKKIRHIFLLEGLFIGGIGTGAGLLVGLGLVFLQDRYQMVPFAQPDSFIIDAFPVSVQMFDLAAIVIIAMGLSILASVYPAARAASVEPARTIQDTAI